MSTILAPFTSSPGPTIRSLTIANLRSGENKIVPSTATNASDGSADGGRGAGVTGVAAVAGAFELGRAGAASIGLAGTIAVGFAGATAGGTTGDVTRADVGAATASLAPGTVGVGFGGAAGAPTADVTRAVEGAGTDGFVTDDGDAPAGGFRAAVVVALLAVLPLPGEAGVATEPAGKMVA